MQIWNKNFLTISAHPYPQENSLQRLLTKSPAEQSMTYVIVRSGQVTDVENISEQYNWVHR